MHAFACDTIMGVRLDTTQEYVEACMFLHNNVSRENVHMNLR